MPDPRLRGPRGAAGEEPGRAAAWLASSFASPPGPVTAGGGAAGAPAGGVAFEAWASSAPGGAAGGALRGSPPGPAAATWSSWLPWSSEKSGVVAGLVRGPRSECINGLGNGPKGGGAGVRTRHQPEDREQENDESGRKAGAAGQGRGSPVRMANLAPATRGTAPCIATPSHCQH